MIDVSQYTGFELQLDPTTYLLNAPEGFSFKRSSRTIGEMATVLLEPNARPANELLYHVFYMEESPASSLLNDYGLTYSPVLLPPSTVGSEFVKTAGHYHPVIPDTDIGYPEVYAQIYGRMWLFLQKRDPLHPHTPLDCVLVEFTPGVTVTIPPEYAHVLINPTDEPALMAGIYSVNFKPEYTEVKAHKGLAYYLVKHKHGMAIQPNLNYENPPPITLLTDVRGTIFEPPQADVPLWTSFLQSPQMYAFLHDADAARARYGNGAS